MFLYGFALLKLYALFTSLQRTGWNTRVIDTSATEEIDTPCVVDLHDNNHDEPMVNNAESHLKPSPSPSKLLENSMKDNTSNNSDSVNKSANAKRSTQSIVERHSKAMEVLVPVNVSQETPSLINYLILWPPMINSSSSSSGFEAIYPMRPPCASSV